MNIRRVKIIAVSVFLAGVAGCMVTSFLGYAVKPKLSPAYGMKLHKELNGEARIYRDKWGIAHVRADNESDLYFAVGYAQAQDRLFQMDLFRRLVEGRLAEIIGDRRIGEIELRTGAVTTLTQDKIHRIIGYKYLGEAGEALLKEYHPEAYRLMESFAAGVNAYIADCGDKTLPMEFRMLDYKPEPWRVADTISLARFVGWSLSSNLNAEILRWAVANNLGEKLAWELLPRYRKPVPEIPTIIPRDLVDYRKVKPIYPKLLFGRNAPPSASPKALAGLSEAITATRLYDGLLQSGHASNNWVIGPKLSASGKPILANDPHLSHMMPATFWTVHIIGAGYDAYGVTFPGVPFIVLGHNRHIAWGCTTSIADVQDVYVEKFDSSGERYLFEGEWEPVVRRKEFLKCRRGLTGPVKDAGHIEVRLTRHGPIINDLAPETLEGAPPMALRWTGYDYTTDQELSRALMTSSNVEEFMERARKIRPENVANEADVMVTLMKASSIEDFKKAMAMHALPDQNWVAVDDRGHFGYMAGGRVPIRTMGDGNMPVPGWEGDYEWVGFIPPEHIPQVFDPERGYITTANNEVVPSEDYPYVFSYLYSTGWRATRIEELLREKKKLTAADMARIQNDTKMVAARYMVPLLLQALDGMSDMTPLEQKARKALENWDYFATTDSIACTIFSEWRRIIPNLILEDDLGELFPAYFHESASFVAVDDMIMQGSPLFDNKNTKQIETRKDVFRATFRTAVSNLKKRLGKNITKWQWGRVHTITFAHPLGIWPLDRYLNYGPLPHQGGVGTVRNAWHRPTDFPTLGGPCLRHVIDMADVDGSLWVIDGGESGQWRNPHYKDGAEMWYRGEYFRAIMNINEVIEQNEGLLKLRLLPEGSFE